MRRFFEIDATPIKGKKKPAGGPAYVVWVGFLIKCLQEKGSTVLHVVGADFVHMTGKYFSICKYIASLYKPRQKSSHR